MPRRIERKRSSTGTGGTAVGYEAHLWQMADTLRGSMDAAKYKHVVLGLIFLKYISDALEEQHAELKAERAQCTDPEDPNEYRTQNTFWVPPEAQEDDGEPFEEKMKLLVARLREQRAETARLEEAIAKNLKYPGYRF